MFKQNLKSQVSDAGKQNLIQHLLTYVQKVSRGQS